MHYRQSQRLILCLAIGGIALTPELALAQSGGGGIFGLIGFFNKLFQELQEFFGYLLALLGIISMGFGVFNIIQHFRTESRDDPNQKSRLVFGLVSFICGVFLAGGAYQTIGSETDFSASIDSPEAIVQQINRTV